MVARSTVCFASPCHALASHCLLSLGRPRHFSAHAWSVKPMTSEIRNPHLQMLKRRLAPLARRGARHEAQSARHEAQSARTRRWATRAESRESLRSSAAHRMQSISTTLPPSARDEPEPTNPRLQIIQGALSYAFLRTSSLKSRSLALTSRAAVPRTKGVRACGESGLGSTLPAM